MFRSRAMAKPAALALIMAAILLPCGQARAAASLCDAVAGNLVGNCGFEGGLSSSTIGGNTNGSVPNGWTADAGFDLEPSFNSVRTSPVNSGNFALSIGNFDAEPAPNLSQVLGDVAGVAASGSLFVDYGGGQGADGAAFFDVLIDGAPVLSLNDTIPNGYAQYDFSFVGTGADTLTLTGNTNPNEWYVDDVVVTQAVAVPEPATIALFGAALALLGLMQVRRRGAG